MSGTEVVATTAEPAFAVNREGRILAWNKAAEYGLGYRQSEVLGRNCWEVLRGRDRSLNRYCGKNCPLLAMAVRGEPIHDAELSFRNALGQTTRVRASTLVVPFMNDREIVHLFECLPALAESTDQLACSAAANHNSRLTARQLEVLKLLATGMTTGEIAEFLCISPATVRHHIQLVLTRLKVHSRLHAVTLAKRIGLL